MALQTDTVFLNQFSKGSQENSNMGLGTILGIETYSKKNIAQLTKDSTKVSGSVVTDLPIYGTSQTSTNKFVQGDTGKVYKTTDGGSTWTDITNPSSSGLGEGLKYYEPVRGTGYLFEWRGTDINYCSTPYTSSNWNAFKTNNLPDFPLITGQHFPFVNPGDGILYFSNGNYVGLIGPVGTTFNPGGATIGVDYIYSTGPSVPNASATVFGLTLPVTYNVNCISFLPPNTISLGTGYSGFGDDEQISDIVNWNPTSTTYNTPLRLYSQSGGATQGGVTQIINRNNTLYAVTAGNHSIYSTLGTAFTQLDDISLHTTGRLIPVSGTGKGTGQQSTAPIFIDQYPSAITVIGNKLMTGVSTSIDSLPTGYGNFPLGVWSEAFSEDGNALQCEFTISSGVVVSKNYKIGLLYPLERNQMLIGWFDGTNYGIDKTEYQNFQNDSSVVMIESEMMEIGTPLEPAVVTTIQENIVRNLLPGQVINVYWRTGFDQPYVLLDSFTSTTGNIQLNNSLKTTVNPIGAAKFLQISLDMETDSPNLAWTPELRNVIVSPK